VLGGAGASFPASFGPPLELPLDPLEPLLELVPLVPEDEPELDEVSPLDPLDPLDPDDVVPDDPSSFDEPGSVPNCELPGGPNSSVLLAPLQAATASRNEAGASRKRSFIDGSRGELPT
jgi:hypothetical protein